MTRVALALALAAVMLWPATVLAQQDPAPMQRRVTEASAERLLDESLLNSPERRARNQERLAAPLPSEDDREALGEALYQRGLAAIELGRQSQAVDDLKRASGLLGSQDRAEALFMLGQAYLNLGHVSRAIAALAEASRLETGPGSQLRNLALMAEQHAKLGDVAATTALLKECQGIAQKIQASKADTNPNVSLWRRTNSLRCEMALAHAQGRLGEVETLSRQIIKGFEDAPKARNSYVLGNRYQLLAENLRAQGRLADAETEARTALSVYQKTVGPTSQRTGTALQGLGRIIAEQGRIKEGETLVRKGMELIQAQGMAGNGGGRLVLADILALDYRWAEAREQFELARQVYADQPDLVDGIMRRNPNITLAMVKTGKAAEALPLLQRHVEILTVKLDAQDYALAQARGLLGIALQALGRHDEARTEFTAALPVLLAQINDEDQETGNLARDQKLRLILEAYMENLVGKPTGRITATPDAIAESFRVAEAARGRSVQRALAASATRAAAANPAIAALVRQVQDTEKQAAALTSLLANAISARAEDQTAAAIDALKSRIGDLKSERAMIMARIGEQFPDYARLLNPKPLSLEEVRPSLRGGEALLSFYSAEDRLYAWAVSGTGPAAMSVSPIGRLDLEARIRKLRDGLDMTVAEVDEFPDFDVKTAAELYAAAIAPIEPAWAGAEILFTIPHGPLGQIPLAVLPTALPKPPAAKSASPPAPLFAKYREVPWLARKVAVAQLPSSGALGLLRSTPPRQTPRRAFVAFGDPLFNKQQVSGQDLISAALTGRGVGRRSVVASRADFTAELGQLPRLRDTADEVKGIAQVLGADPEQDLFLQARASVGMVRQLDLARWRVVMFATHGLIPGDLAGLDQPALALSSPAVTGDGSSGLLTMEAIMGLKLDADWVVLSACNTAAGDGSGSEAVSGLGRAFFYAGTRALLVTNWPVETVSARLLTTDLFRRQAEDPALSRAQALRRAMLGLMDGPGTGSFTYAHPTFWAPYSLVGDGG
ncbi:CHAT domain-containing tetratricopeptide repeat protein [Paramagnetospirillum marisnigri]|uniref:CHAT domain-containing tetratricopeptide repeat protein n=1 Tax=Paramagnetospirillum marisnigri TaxID=1285242 RepID=UPI000837B377|nr:CHAT domain-containing protein [Paramagnetospirillum marisnigri]